MTTKKRFIAGAICPSCKGMDKIQVYQHEGKDVRECVACGFSDRMHFKPQMRELETRVNVSAEQKQGETQVVKLLDPSQSAGS